VKALSLTQPWAWLMVHGPKRIENRPWNAPRAIIGQRFALHAALSWDAEAHEDVLEEVYGPVPPGYPEVRAGFAAGAIIGLATLDRVVQLTSGLIPTAHELAQVEPDQRRWFFGPYGFVLSGMTALRGPVRCKGSLSFWTVPPDLELEIRQLLPVAA
jgi:hypothetical protein